MDSLTRLPDLAPIEALPPEAPLAMPEQDLRAAPPGRKRPASPPGMALRRAAVFIPAILLTAFTAREMHLVLGVNGVTTLEAAILVVFVTLFAWIALALFSSLAGFVVLLSRPKAPPLPDPASLPRTALLMPAYNEDPARTMAALATIRAELVRLGASHTFDVFILSDTTDPDAWIAEEAAWLALRRHTGMERVFYRRRPHNTHRKAGNIADWVRRWGGAYPQFMILDADSLMTGECILHLAGAMAREPTLGLVQSLPVIVGGQTLFARMQQFAGRVYGPMIAHGLAWWAGADGNYWGHNAMIRTQAFAEAAGLPTLSGRKPFGGTILSHDFVEAALLRRAGWGVVMRPELAGSFEESPPSLIELAIRDRRWCQGNLQHIAVLPTRGLHPVSRLHLLMGIGSYVTAPLWLLFLVMGILISLQARFILPEYFPQGRSLFPAWPSIDPVRSMYVFIGTMAVLLGPKLLAWFAMLLRADERRGCGGAIRSLASVLVETVVAGLLAPVAMLSQSSAVVGILAGRDGGWQPQVRDDGRVPFAQVARRYWPHTAMGALLALASWLVSVPLLLWMSPVVLGLGLAIPLATLTGRRGAGRALRRLGLLQTPEEAAPPTVLTDARALAPSFATPHARAIPRLLSDPALFAAHRAMLPPPRRPGDPFDPNLLLAVAKVSEMLSAAETNSLTRGELAALLGSEEGLDRLQALAG